MIGLVIAVSTANQTAWEIHDYANRLTLAATGSGNLSMSGSLALRSKNCTTYLNGGKLSTNSTGDVDCYDDISSGGSTGTGALQTAFDKRYLKKQGDTATGTLHVVITGGNAQSLGFNTPNTMSGNVVRAQNLLESSGGLIIRGRSAFQNTTMTQGTMTGWHLFAGTMSGAGLTSCSNATTSKLLYDSSARTFSCGADQNTDTPGALYSSTGSLQTFFNGLYFRSNTGAIMAVLDGRYVNTAGDTMTGALVHKGPTNTNVITEQWQTQDGRQKGRLTSSGALSLSGSFVNYGGLTFGGVTTCTDLQTSSTGVVSCNNAVYLASSTGSLKVLFDANYLRTSTGSLKAFFDANYLRTSTGSLKTFFDANYLRTSTGSLKTLFDANYFRTSTGSLKVFFDANYFRTSSGSLKTYFNKIYVKRGGDTMTGGLLIVNGGAGTQTIDSNVLLEIAGTSSGRILRAQDTLASSGTLVVAGATTLKSTVSLNGVTYTFPYSDGTATGKVLKTDSAGHLSWSTDSTSAGNFGTGNVVTIGNMRYVSHQGDAMTGGLMIVNGGHTLTAIDAGLLLEVAGTASGRILHAQDELRSSGSLAVKGATTLKNTVSCTTLQTSSTGLVSCNNAVNLASSTGSLKVLFDSLYLRTSTGSLKTFFDANYLRTSTGSLKVFFDANYLRTSTGSLKTFFDAQYLRTSSGALKTYFDKQYVNIAGDTMTGGLLLVSGGAGTQTIDSNVLLEIAGVASGRVLRAQNTLASSGGIVAKNDIMTESGGVKDALSWLPSQSFSRKLQLGFGNGALGNSATPAEMTMGFSGTTVMDTTHINTNSNGFDGAVFDGRYLYLVPQAHATVLTRHGQITRYDTLSAFRGSGSYAVMDTMNINANSKGFVGGVFDGKYVYFVPDIDSGSGQIMRYDPNRNFRDSGAYLYMDVSHANVLARGFAGATFDGRFIYFTPVNTGQVTRYDTLQPFRSSGAYSFFDTSAVQADSGDFWGSVYDGRYVYFVPRQGLSLGWSGQITRYDTTKPFGLATSYTVMDTAHINSVSKGFKGAVYDGRYIYLVPNYAGVGNGHGTVTRYDTSASFTSSGSYAVMDMTHVNTNSKMFDGAVFDGRYIYFVPRGLTTLLGQVTRYDTTQPFRSSGAYTVYDTTGVDSNSKGFGGGAYDGRYVYLIPFTYAASTGNGQITRLDAWAGGPDATPGLTRLARGSDFYIDSAGKIGIGTNTPEVGLEIIGAASGTILHAQNTLTSSGGLVWEGSGSGSSMWASTITAGTVLDSSGSLVVESASFLGSGAIISRPPFVPSIQIKDTTNSRIVGITTGSGSPIARVVGSPGSFYMDSYFGSMYFKTSGVSTNKGWDQIVTASGATGMHMAKLYRGSAQSINTSQLQKIYLDTIEFDVGGISNVAVASTGSGRITIKKAGIYLITASFALTGPDLGEFNQIYVYKNNALYATALNYSPLTNGTPFANLATTASLAVGDYIEVFVFHNEGAALSTLTGADYRPQLTVTEVNAAAPN